MADTKLNPTLFEKLTVGGRTAAILDEGRSELTDLSGRGREITALNLDRYSEAAMRASVRRELSWLLNTVRLEAVQDLSATPHVKTSVLNYGLPDLTGKSSTELAVQARAREMEAAIRNFEPRMAADRLRVEAEPGVGPDNAISYVIRGDITAAVRAMPVQFFANVEVETGEAVVQD